jgi:enoyl-CoA hydratase/carnithine racemase
LDLPLPAAMGLLTPVASRAMASADQDEGVAAFREKRAPRWTGR